MQQLILEPGDQAILNTGYIIEIITEQKGHLYEGSDVNDGYQLKFSDKEIECIKKKGLKHSGGDGVNYWLFYTGPGYPNSTPLAIANYAHFELRDTDLFDMSIEEIIHKHIYWATDSSEYNALYNGDTYVLFIDKNKLSENMRKDAELYIN